MDPLFRKGMHFAAQMTKDPVTGGHTDASRSIDAVDCRLNAMLMERTLQPPDAEQLRNLQEELERQGRGEETLSTLLKNQEQQCTMAKMMFICYAAGVRIRKDGAQTDFDRSMGDLFAHGGRLMIDLPAGSLQSKQFDAIVGKHTGDAAGVYGRVFATHAVENATLNADGSVRRNADGAGAAERASGG